jgi:uncharacterized membrane protein YeaQ/YmgE (transglycosylase-associated protein family)
MNKSEAKKFANKKIPILLGKKWDELTTKGREEMIEEATELFYEDSNKVDKDLKNINNKMREAIFFFLGILFGIIGGLVATIIHSFLSKYGLIYYFIVLLTFVLLCIILVNLIRSEISRIYQSNELLCELTKRAKELLEKNDK